MLTQNAFFDISLANTNASLQKHLRVITILKNHEKEKKEPVIVEL